MEDRLAELQVKFDELTGAVKALEARVAVLEGKPLPEAGAPPPEEGSLPEPAGLVPAAGVATQILSLIGRSLLVLGGAYLIRALTEGGSIARPVGVLAGLLYALGSAVLAERAGRKGETQSAAFHGCLSVLIAYPLIWEAGTRMAVLSPLAAALCLVALTALLVAIAWRQNLPVFAWAAVLASSGSAIGLMLTTHALVPFSAALIAMGGGTLWLTYGRRWHGLRWPVALAADLAIVISTLVAASPKGLPETYRDLSVPGVLAVAIGLVAIYPGSFAIRIVARHRSVNVFEIVQTILALLAGFGGAVRVARTFGSGEAVLGATALLAAAGCYGVALVFAERREEWSRNFHFFTTLALLLTLSTARLVTGSALAPLLWSGLGLAGAVLAVRLRRITLRAHGAILGVAAAAASGLLTETLHAFLLPVERTWTPMDTPSLICLALAVASYLVLAVRRDPGLSFASRLPDLTLALLSAAGIGAVAVTAAASLLRSPGGTLDPGSIAVTRTAVLAIGAFLLAFACQKTGLPEFGWIAYLLLVAGGGKLVLEDLQLGSSATRFPAFILFGAAMILVPRLLRQHPKAGSAQES
ncbi:MAG: hypothetical protein DIJKHBIC_02359 [Thermoanaerobaculia bacterium]|nr:hypothetical protein [Thermoanaerobaculia bacterium]